MMFPSFCLKWKSISSFLSDTEAGSNLTSQISKGDMGIYEVFLRDERGKDKSTFSLTDAGMSSPVEN